MKLEIEVHPVQAEILNTLLFKRSARFSDLNTTELTNDHFTFHLKRLLELGLVEKEGTDYTLTVMGKEFANRFDTDEKVIEKQAKVAALVVPIKKEGNKTLFLAQQRLKQPYYGFWGWTTGKIKWGEEVVDAAARELKEETGVSGKITLKGVWHKRDYKENGDLLEDKYFFVCIAEDVKGHLLEKFKGGRNSWMTIEELLKQEKVFEAVDKAAEIATNESLMFYSQKCSYSEEEY